MTKAITEQLSITDVIAITTSQKTELSPPAQTTTQKSTSRCKDEPEDDNFYGEDSDCRVLAEQPAIAVYMNRRGDVVIRQERAWDQDEDRLVFVRPENLERFIRALQTYMPQSVS